MKNKIFLSLLFITSIMTAQNKVENPYYSISIPSKTNVKLYQSSHESLSNIDSYQFLVDGKPKYIYYMMSNKLETSVTVGMDNFNDFLFDIGDIDITNVEMFNDFIKVYFKYKTKNAIEGAIYIGIRGDILNRFLVMYPNASALKSFNEEVNLLLKDVTYKKSKWGQ